jgi:Domain of unknown function (DUF5753)/Helix-turn-helix domain
MWGTRLRVIRTERCGLSLERAAKLAGWHGSKLSRTERGLRPVSIADFATLITAWGVPAKEREEVLDELAVGPSGLWDHPVPGVAGWATLASFESEAVELITVATAAIPGLLQTHETAEGILHADGVPKEDIQTIWSGRLRRQRVLGKVDYSVFMTEAALTTPWGGRDAHRKQLAHLLHKQEIGLVRIRIIPPRQTGVLLLHTWNWMRFRHTSPVVHVELSVGATYIHDAARYTATLARLEAVALPKEGSRTLIRHLMER